MKPINSIKALCLRAAFCILAVGSNQVLANSDELIEKGKKVYNEVAGIGCKTCHGEYAEGDLGVGPFIRGASEGAIRAAVSAVGEMIVVRQAITEEELKAVAAYLEYLGTLQVVRTLSKRGRFVPKAVEVRPGADLQVIIKNSSIRPHTYTSEGMGIESMTIQGRSTGTLVWKAPDREGTFTIACTDCRLNEELTIKVSKNAKPVASTVGAGTSLGNADM